LVRIFLSRVEIKGFRSHYDTNVNLFNDMNILIGQNNTGKTSFLQAIDYVLGITRKSPIEDDFYISNKSFNPQNAKPIKIIIEFRETDTNRFNDTIIKSFNNAIQFDENIINSQSELDPIRFFKICYEYKYNTDLDKFEDIKYFVDMHNQRLKPLNKSIVKKEHLEYFPFYYLRSLRNLRNEIKNKKSYWSKIKEKINYQDKMDEILSSLKEINKKVLENDVIVEKIKNKLIELKNNIIFPVDTIELNTFSKRDWEILDNLNIYYKLEGTNFDIPFFKSGDGTQNILLFLIFTIYIELMIESDKKIYPIIGLEEPEVHIHPQAQRALFQQISKIKGQKIISTHSPYIVDQSDIYNFILFKLFNNRTIIKKIPKYKTNFDFKYGLSNAEYIQNKYFNNEEELLIKRFILYKNPELFFSSAFILCEGESEKFFIEGIFPYYYMKKYKVLKYLNQLGVSVIQCEGKTYTPFLKISKEEAFDLDWLILSG